MRGVTFVVLGLLFAVAAALAFGGAGPLTSVPAGVRTLVLVEVRLPRVLVALLVGAALGASGAALQGLFRNPLADPSILGVSSSAALFSQVAIFAGWAAVVPSLLPVLAIGGAALATFFLLRLVRTARHGALELLILGGVALGQVAVALSALLLSVALRDFTTAQRLLSWMLGSLDGRTWMHVFWGLGPVVSATLWLMFRSRALDGMSLGDETAHSLGVDVRRVRREVVIAAAILSGVAVAMGGVVSFVGLIVPHLMRTFIGASHRILILSSALFGSFLLVLCDLVCRTVIAPAELQIGVLTAVLGAPWFVWLLRRRFAEVL